jgi:hypothetical protein
MDKKKTPMPIIAGILMIVSAGLKLLAIFGLSLASVFAMVPGNVPRVGAFLVVFLLVVALLIIALEIAAGILSLQRRRWGWALAGSIVSVLPFSFLGIAALVLVALSRDEFE